MPERNFDKNLQNVRNIAHAAKMKSRSNNVKPLAILFALKQNVYFVKGGQ